MAAFNKIADFVENLAEPINLGSDQLTVALSNVAPGSESTPPTGDGDGILGNITQINYANLSARTLTRSSSAQTGGTYKLVLADLTLSASGGDANPFQYIYIFDDTVASPLDPLVGFYDRGSALTLLDGESLLIDFSAANGVLQLV